MKKALPYILSVISILTLWFILSTIINSDLILPSPLKVFALMLLNFRNINYWSGFSFTYLRVCYAFLISTAAGFCVGCLCGKSLFFKRFFEIPVAIIRCTPVVAIILVALFWFTSGTVPVFVAVLMALPVMITSVQSGFEYIDKNLVLMADSFNFSRKQKFLHVTIPSIMPAVLKGAQQVFGLCWKVIVAGEVLSLPMYGIGTLMQYNQVHIETIQVMALGLSLVVLGFLFEKLLGLFVKLLLKVIL